MKYKYKDIPQNLKAAFIDRDGTIAYDYPDEEWANVQEPVLLPHAIDVLKRLCGAGYKIIIITNQYIIGEGYITEQQYQEYNEKLLKILKESGISVLDVFYCPHSRQDNCDCIKPKAGLIKAALDKYPTINLDESFVVGDSICDAEFAKNTGIASYGIGFDYDYDKFTRINCLKELYELL